MAEKKKGQTVEQKIAEYKKSAEQKMAEDRRSMDCKIAAISQIAGILGNFDHYEQVAICESIILFFNLEIGDC